MSRVLTTGDRGSQPRSAPATRTGYERSFLWELPFWCSLLFWSLYPSLRTPWVDIASIPISSKELLALALAGFYMLHALSFAAVNHRFISDHPAPGMFSESWHCHLPVLTIGIVGYAALSATWSGMSARDRDAMLYTLISTAGSVVLGYLLIANRSSASVHSFLWRLTLYLAGLGLLYSAESFLSLGLRSELGKELDLGDFGIQRVRGPLFASSTGFFILLPATAFAVQQLLRRRAQRLLSWVLVLALIIALIGLGSRAGLLLVGLYLLLLMFVKGKQKDGVISLLIPAMLLAAVLVFSAAETSRLQDFTEQARADTHRTSWQIIINRSLVTNSLGSGLGSYWPWYLPEVEFGTELYDLGLYTNLVSNPFGALLYHPHSTFLLLAVEMGVLGLLYFIALWAILLRVLWRSLCGGPSALFGIGVVVSGFSMFFDFFLFRTPQLNALWWSFLFGALALTTKPRTVEQRERLASRSSPRA